jgi:uncharacterized protein
MLFRFEWDPVKDRQNLHKHGLSFETAQLAFEDPWILSRKDVSHNDAEERYNGLGEIAAHAIVFVVFAVREVHEAEIIRLISARFASKKEKMAYEEARSRSQTGYRFDRRQIRRRD